MCEGETFSMN